jgi:hypothetical protein
MDDKTQQLQALGEAEGVLPEALRMEVIADRGHEFTFADGGHLMHSSGKSTRAWMSDLRVSRLYLCGQPDDTLAKALAGNLTAAGVLYQRHGPEGFAKLAAAQGLIPGKPAKPPCGKSTNPWHADNFDPVKTSFNMTNISKLVKNLGVEKATAIARSVGCDLLSSRPANYK